MATFLNYIIESTIQPVKTNVLWIKNGVPYYFNKRWKPLLGGGSGIVDSPIIFGDGVNNAILKDSYNITNGENTVALGYNLTTNNFAEAAFGKYNNSIKSDDPSKATLFSVGNGVSDTLKNVFEIKYNGSIYIDGIEKSIQEYLKNLEFNYNNINTEFSEAIIKINGSIKDTNSRITQTSEAIRLEVSQIEKSLDNKISENSTQILQTAEEIQFVAKRVVDVDDKVTTQQTLINQTSDKVNILAIKNEELDSRIRQNTSQIEQTSESINLRVTEIAHSLGDLEEQVVENNTAINQTSKDIELLAQENKILSEKVTKNEADIKINSDKIALSVTQESFDTLSTKVEENSSEIEVNKNAIKTKVEQNTFDAYSRESSSKFTEIEQTVDAITTTVQSNSGEITIIKTDIEGLTAKTGTLEADIDTLKKQSDGAIDTHFGTVIPTLDNEPAINWTTEELKREHVGDLYYNNVSGEAFRFTYNPETDTYFWVMLSDSALTEALDKISKLEEAIDGKVSIFYTQPSNYKYGDIWFVHNNAYSPYKESSLLTATNIDKNAIIETFNLDHWVLKSDIVKSLDDLDKEVTNAFKDKILTSAEVDAIRENKKSFEASFEELSSSHAIIVASTLEDTTSLNLAFSELENKYTLLIQAINSLILDSDGNLDEGLIQNYTNNYNSYLEALKNYSKIKAELTDSIQKSLSSANDYIKDITSDGVLTSIEKKNFLEIWRGFTEEFNSNKGIAVNYKIIDSEGNKRTDIYETDEYYSNYLLYSTAFNDVKSIFESDVFGLSNITESTKLPTGYSVGDIEASFDNYYNALSIFSEMISKITIEITDAHEKVLQLSRELQEQLTPSDSITQIGKGVILSSIIGVQSNGVLQAGLNATNIEGLVDDSVDNHGRIILAGGIKGKTNWNDATTVIYEDGHIKINSGEIGEFVEIGSALIKSVISGKIDLFSYPETINGVTSLIPLFQINKDATGKIISISTVYDLYVNGNLVISGDVASGGDGENTPAEGTVTSIEVDGTPYIPNTLGVIDLTDAFKNVSAFLSDYYTKEEINSIGFLTSASLNGYAKETWVNEQIKNIDFSGYATIDELSKYVLLTATSQTITGEVIIDGNLIVKGDVASGNEGEDTPAEGTVTGIRVDANTLLEPTAGIIDMTDVFANLDISDQLENYYTRGEVDVKIAGIDFSPYAKITDVADTYATKTALSTLQSSHDTLRTEFDALNDALNDDVSGKINTWNEIKDFLDEYSGSEDLATIISKINADIAKRALQSDLTALETRVDTAEGNITSLTNGKADKSELSKYVLLEKASQTIKGDITIEGNLVITGDVASGGEGGNTSAEGTVTGVTVSGVDYTSVEAGLLDLTDLMANYALKSASTKVSVSPSLSSGKSIGVISVDGVGTTLYAPATYAWSEISGKLTDSGVFSFIDSSFTLKALWFNYRTLQNTNLINPVESYHMGNGAIGYAGVVASKFIVDGGTSSQFLKADGSVDSTSYLPTSGGTLTANDNPLSLASTSARVFQVFRLGTANKGSVGYVNGLVYIGNDTGNYARIGVNDDGIPQYWSSNNASTAQTLLHSGNFGEYALKIDGSNAMTSPLVLKHDTPRIIFRNASDLYGSVGFESGELKAQLMIGGSWAWHTLLHSGNVGNYALQYYGTNMPADIVNYVGYGKTETGWKEYGPAITFGLSNYYTQIQRRLNTTEYYVRGYDNGTYTDWKTIAFTDSDITGNAATATKIQTARTIWGQSFDGTANVEGDLSIRYSKITFAERADDYHIGWGSNNMLVYANYYGHYFTTDGSERMRIVRNGYVLIGTTTEKESGPLLQVNGGGYFSADTYLANWAYLRSYKTDGSKVSVIGINNNNLLLINAADSGVNTAILGGNVLIGATTDSGNKLYVRGDTRFDGQTRISGSMRFYGKTNLSSDMYINNQSVGGLNFAWSDDVSRFFIGNNVGIGTTSPAYRLDVAGTGRFTGDLTVEGYASITAILNLTRNAGANYIWANKAGSTIALGVQDVGPNGIDTASLLITASTLLPGNRRGVVSLGSASYRWSTIYGVNGDFSNAVTVSGTLTANSGATITGTVTINGNLIVSGDVASGGTGQDTPSDGTTTTTTTAEWYNIKTRREPAPSDGNLSVNFYNVIENYNEALNDSSKYRMVIMRFKRGSYGSKHWAIPMFSNRWNRDTGEVINEGTWSWVDFENTWWSISSRIVNWFANTGATLQTSGFSINTKTDLENKTKFSNSNSKKMRMGVAIYKKMDDGLWQRVSNIAEVMLFVNNYGDIYTRVIE